VSDAIRKPEADRLTGFGHFARQKQSQRFTKWQHEMTMIELCMTPKQFEVFRDVVGYLADSGLTAHYGTECDPVECWRMYDQAEAFVLEMRAAGLSRAVWDEVQRAIREKCDIVSFNIQHGSQTYVWPPKRVNLPCAI
jgi:hypothetical protein